MQPYGKSNLQYFQQWDLSRGLITNANEREVGPGGATACNNFIWRDGFLRTRPGIAAYETQAGTLRTVHHIGKLSAVGMSSDMWIQIQGDGTTAWMYTAAGGGAWSAGTDQVGALSADRIVTGCAFNGAYYFCMGEAELRKMNTSGTLSEVHSGISTPALRPPGGPKLVAANSSHLFLADVVDVDPTTRVSVGGRIPYRIQWCDTLNANVWGAGVGAGSSGIVDLADEADAITGLYVQNENIMAFKRRTIYYGQFIGPPVFYTFRRGVSGIGCVCAATIKEWKDGTLIWLGDDGVYLGGFGRQPQMISQAINQRIRDTCSTTRFKSARALMDADLGLYHLFLPDIITPYTVNHVFTFNLNNGSWWEGTLGNSLDVTATADFSYGVLYGATVNDFWTRTKLIAGTAGTIYYYTFGVITDAGTAISCSWTSGYLPAYEMGQRQVQQVEPQTARVFGKSTVGNVSLQVAGLLGYDRNTPTSPIATATQGVDGTSDLYVVGRGGPAEFLQLTLSCTGISTTKIAGYEIGYLPWGDNVRKR